MDRYRKSGVGAESDEDFSISDFKWYEDLYCTLWGRVVASSVHILDSTNPGNLPTPTAIGVLRRKRKTMKKRAFRWKQVLKGRHIRGKEVHRWTPWHHQIAMLQLPYHQAASLLPPHHQTATLQLPSQLEKSQYRNKLTQHFNTHCVSLWLTFFLPLAIPSVFPTPVLPVLWQVPAVPLEHFLFGLLSLLHFLWVQPQQSLHTFATTTIPSLPRPQPQKAPVSFTRMTLVCISVLNKKSVSKCYSSLFHIMPFSTITFVSYLSPKHHSVTSVHTDKIDPILKFFSVLSHPMSYSVIT